MVISQCYNATSQYYLIISILVIWSYHHIMPGNHKIILSNESPRAASVLSSHSQATASHQNANIQLSVRNRHIKSARKWVILGREQALVKDNRTSFDKKLRVVPSHTFYRRVLQNFLRKIVFLWFCRKSKKWNFGALEFPPSAPVR